MKRLLLVPTLTALLICLVSGGVRGDEALARRVVEMSGRSRGICLVPRASDVSLALSLARESGLTVCALFPDAESVDAGREAAADSGLLGRRLYVAQGGPADMLLADSYADLLVVADGDPPDLSLEGIARVLTPVRGRAIIGGPDTNRSALKEWADGAAQAGLEAGDVVEDDQGLWVVLSKPRPEGADSWSHVYHGPDNNPVTDDSAFQLPYMTRWFGKPYNHQTRNGTNLVANGRVFVMARGHFVWQRGSTRHNIFCAYSAHNGELLWQRDLPVKYKSGFSNLIAVEDELWMLLGGSVVRLDAETGSELRRIPISGINGYGKWMGLVDGKLVVLVGAADSSTDFPPPGAELNNREVSTASQEVSTTGTSVLACDPDTGYFDWTHEVETPIEARMIAVAGGRVFYFADPGHIGALDLECGDLLWKNADEDFIAQVTETNREDLGLFHGVQRGMAAHPDAVVVGSIYSPFIGALDAQSGEVLWTKPTNRKADGSMSQGRLIRHFIRDHQLWSQGTAYDLKTGEVVREVNAQGGGCGLWTASARYICGQFGLSYDLQSDRSLGAMADVIKTPCQIGTIAAEGLYYWPSGPCTCGLPLRGYRVVGPDHLPAETAGERLQKGAGDITEVAGLPTEPADWPAYRGGGDRSSSTPLSLAAKPELKATALPELSYWQPGISTEYEPEHVLTPPVAVGDRVFVGGSDGRVVCMDGESGERLWQRFIGGHVFGAPYVWQGRLYVAGGDGYVYAFEAATGRPLWRFRVAPVERRVMVFGELMSTWPVVSGALVHDGLLYAAAGLTAEDGARVVALNAETGELAWECADLAPQFNRRMMGRIPCGHLTVARGRLWVQCANYAYTAFDLKSGEMAPLRPLMEDDRKKQGRVGKDLTTFRDGYLLYGGQRALSDQSERAGSRYKIARWAGLSFVPLGEDGLPDYPEVSPFSTALMLPAWDDDVIVGPLYYQQAPDCWSMPRFLNWLDEQWREGKQRKFPWYRHSRVGIDSNMIMKQVIRAGEEPDLPMHLWGSPDSLLCAAVVASDAVILAEGRRSDRHSGWDVWTVRAHAKQSGKMLWEVELPGEPLYDGMCVTRDGTLVVALRSGGILLLKP